MTVRRFAVLITLIVATAILAACGPDSVPAPVDSFAPTPAGAGVPTQPPAPVDAPVAPPTEPPAIARVNGEPILLADYQNEVAQYEAEKIAEGVDPNTPDGQAQLAEVREQVLNGMIDTLLIVQEARLKGITVSETEFEAERQNIISISGGPEAFAAYLAANGQNEEDYWAGLRVSMLYNKMRDQVIANVPAVAPQAHARHILIDSADLANSLLSQLQAGADFTSLAQQYSQDTLTRDGGGDLGWFSRGQLVSKEVEDAAFALQPGQYSGVVQSAFGFHIVQVIETDPARPIDADPLRELQKAAVERWLASLRAAANIER